LNEGGVHEVYPEEEAMAPSLGGVHEATSSWCN
jgi:hypothetical protein